MTTTETLTLSDFLLARIAEDEAVVQMRQERGEGRRSSAMSASYGHTHFVMDPTDPARVLAECEAKRVIVELRYSWNLQAERMTEPPFGPILQTQVNTADAILRTLAKVYADHPDYRDEWRP